MALSQVPEVLEGPEPPPIGHNSPPQPIQASLGLTPEQWSEWMAHVFEGLAARKAELAGAVARFATDYPLVAARTPDAPPIGIEKWSKDVQGRHGDLRNGLAKIVAQAKTLHGIEKRPVLDAATAIDSAYNSFIKDIQTWIEQIRVRQNAYANYLEAVTRWQAEAEARRLREEADKAAQVAAAAMSSDALDALDALDAAAEASERAEEAAAVATAPAADLSRVRGVMGSTTSLRTTWVFDPEASNLRTLVKAVAAGLAPIEYLTFNETRIKYLVKSEKLRDAPGLAIVQKRSV